MKVHQNHSNITQNMHGASKSYRNVWDVSPIKLESRFLWNWKNRPRYLVPWRYQKTFLTPDQWHLVGIALCLASRFTAKERPGLVQFARYISTPIALRY